MIRVLKRETEKPKKSMRGLIFKRQSEMVSNASERTRDMRLGKRPLNFKHKGLFGEFL